MRWLTWYALSRDVYNVFMGGSWSRARRAIPFRASSPSTARCALRGCHGYRNPIESSRPAESPFILEKHYKNGNAGYADCSAALPSQYSGLYTLHEYGDKLFPFPASASHVHPFTFTFPFFPHFPFALPWFGGFNTNCRRVIFRNEIAVNSRKENFCLIEKPNLKGRFELFKIMF